MSALVIWLAAMVAPLTMASTVEVHVDKQQGADEWSCDLEAELTATIVSEGALDRVTVTVQKVTARMAAKPGMPAAFRDQIASESPAQQRAIEMLTGKSAAFVIDHKTGKLKSDGRFVGGIDYAGVDVTFWLARAWFSGAPRTVPTFWGPSWSLSGNTAGKASPYLAESGELGGELTIGKGSQATAMQLKVTLRPRR